MGTFARAAKKIPYHRFSPELMDFASILFHTQMMGLLIKNSAKEIQKDVRNQTAQTINWRNVAQLRDVEQFYTFTIYDKLAFT